MTSKTKTRPLRSEFVSGFRVLTDTENGWVTIKPGSLDLESLSAVLGDYDDAIDEVDAHRDHPGPVINEYESKADDAYLAVDLELTSTLSAAEAERLAAALTSAVLALKVDAGDFNKGDED